MDGRTYESGWKPWVYTVGFLCAHLIGLIIFAMSVSLEVSPSHTFVNSKIIN